MLRQPNISPIELNHFLYVICSILLLIEVDRINLWKHKVINPPSFFPFWIFWWLSLFVFLFTKAFIPATSWNICLISTIGALLLTYNQARQLKRLYKYQQTPTYVRENIQIKNDSFKKSYSFYGPNIFCKTSVGNMRFCCMALGSESEKGFLSLVGQFNRKYNFSPEAYDNHGNKIYITSHIDKTVTSYQTSYQDSNRKITNQCGNVIGEVEGATHYETHYRTDYTESFGIVLPFDVMKNIEAGYQIKLYGDKEIIIELPYWYIQTFTEEISNKPEFKKINWL